MYPQILPFFLLFGNRLVFSGDVARDLTRCTTRQRFFLKQNAVHSDDITAVGIVYEDIFSSAMMVGHIIKRSRV